MHRGVNLPNNMERSRRQTSRVDYTALNKLSSVDLVPDFKEKKRIKPGSKLYQVERLISKRKSATRDDEYLVKWKDLPVWTSSWEPSAHLSDALIRGFNSPKISSEGLEQAAVVFTEAILGVLKCKAVKATHAVQISLDHDILRYVFRGRGRISGDGVSMLYEKDDFRRLCLPPYWNYYLNRLGQGVAVSFPLKLKSILGVAKKRFIVSNGEAKQAPSFPVEKVIITVNRRACDTSNI